MRVQSLDRGLYTEMFRCTRKQKTGQSGAVGTVARRKLTCHQNRSASALLQMTVALKNESTV